MHVALRSRQAESRLDGLDALLLARLQFAFTVSFHFLFPAFTIGLASFLAVLEGLWLVTGRPHYLDLFRYWLKIFALVFAMGVVSGLVMSYQFGTNWPVLSDRAGPVIGPLMAYEVLTAFFLEAGFLGVMLFGMRRVGNTVHFAATLMVAIGTCASAFWILSVNSWMHTPAGYAINDVGQFVPAGSWWDIVFNPSFPVRFAHTLTASYLTTAFIVGGVAARHLLNGRDDVRVRTMFSMALWMALLVAPTQVFLGDLHGLDTLQNQPVKVMAMEGHYRSYPNGAPLILFGIPNATDKRIDYRIEIPQASSLILKRDPNAPIDGLDTVPDDLEPPVAPVFWSFRVMVGIGLLMVGVGLWGLISRLRGTLYRSRVLHRCVLLMAPSGLIAVLAGWLTTEIGRQPWVVHGLLRTAEAATTLPVQVVAASLVAFVLIYCAVFGVGIAYVLKLMAGCPLAHEPELSALPTRSAGLTPAAVVVTRSAP